jgi:hypothetical protein
MATEKLLARFIKHRHFLEEFSAKPLFFVDHILVIISNQYHKRGCEFNCGHYEKTHFLIALKRKKN